MSLKNVIFDLDGTLIDSAPHILSSYSAALNSCGIDPIIQLESSIIGPPLRETLIKLTGVTDSDVLNALIAEFKSDYDNVSCLETRLFQGVDDMLEQLKSLGLRLFVATNKRKEPCFKIINQLGKSGCFDAIYTLDFFEPPKSNKTELIRQLMADLGLKSAESIYIGDREEDGLAADKNMISFFYAAWGYGSDFLYDKSQFSLLGNHPKDVISLFYDQLGDGQLKVHTNPSRICF